MQCQHTTQKENREPPTPKFWEDKMAKAQPRLKNQCRLLTPDENSDLDAAVALFAKLNPERIDLP
jgi:hypothetical protein